VIETEMEPGQAMGLGPQSTKKGDVIAILYGCSVPVILRPHPQDRKCYSLIGEAYVYEIMDGEALEMPFAEESFPIV
jgi:hypothetical protein